MSLNKDTMGAARATAMSYFCNRTLDDLITEFGTLAAVRIAVMKADSEAIINHIKANATVPGAGLVAPAGGGVVTGTAAIQ